jgi:haloalkane dehalogenase
VALELEDIVLVIHDWGSMLGLDYARRNSDNVKGVVFMEAIVPPAFPMESVAGMGSAGELFAAFRKPETGKPLLIDQNIFVEQIVGNAAVTRAMSEAEMAVYRAPFLDPATRFPIYVWPNELPIGGEPARNVEAVEKVGQWLRTSGTPKLLLYARPGAIVGPEAAEWMAANYRNIETRFVGYGAHYIQEDNPEVIGRSIADWYRQLDR